MSAPLRLADLTTLRVGGPARSAVTAGTTDELVEAVRTADAAGEPVLLVGGGSNLLVSDAGFPGTVILVRSRGVTVHGAARQVAVTVAAGEPWDDLVARGVASGWSGLEALSGIPGSTGATPVQNVGAYGAEVASCITAVEVLDRRRGQRGQVRTLTPDQAGFGYRTSALKRTPDAFVVLSVSMRLTRDAQSAPVSYAELARVLGVAVGTRVPSVDVRAAVLELRRGKGMVLDPADHDTWSAGSFFTNPVLAPAQADTLPPEAPRFPQPDGRVKTSAAWLITHAGFERGFAVRPGAPAALSGKHALALTNRGTATARDLLELAHAVRAGVAERFGIVLENEPTLVGCVL